MSQPDTPASPVPAATVMLLRDGADGLEVFMVVRHHQIDFASGALVFPGGKADPQDFEDALLPYLSSPARDPAMRAVQVASIREAFEECGVLLARQRGHADLIAAAELEDLQRHREPLNKGELSLLEFLSAHDLILACDGLTHFARWITPPMMPKRFDTHFYLAHAPADQLALHDGYESVDSVWISPAQALADAAAGTRTVIFPTLKNIEKLDRASTVDEAVRAAQNDTIVPVLPWTEQREDGTYLCIPPEAGYAGNEQKMPDQAS